MNKDEALRLALEKLKKMEDLLEESITALKAALAQPEQEPVAHPVIAGVLFDFMGWLTSRKERIVLSSTDEASPAVDAITNFAKMRGLSLDDARVQDWHTAPPQRTWVGLTDWEREAIAHACGAMSADWLVFIEAVEKALKEKNGFRRLAGQYRGGYTPLHVKATV